MTTTTDSAAHSRTSPRVRVSIDAVCDCLCANHPVPVKKVGMQDVFGESGSAAALVEKYGLDAKGVYKSVKEFL